MEVFQPCSNYTLNYNRAAVAHVALVFLLSGLSLDN